MSGLGRQPTPEVARRAERLPCNPDMTIPLCIAVSGTRRDRVRREIYPPGLFSSRSRSEVWQHMNKSIIEVYEEFFTKH